eukprot:m.437076 g.437076  ORF g.437076 m.437076 type:complete len:465 (+) comp21430_c0_seq1:242-1636(+)
MSAATKMRRRTRHSSMSEQASKVSTEMAEAKETSDVTRTASSTEGVFVLDNQPDANEMEAWMRIFEKNCLHDFEKQMRREVQPDYKKTTTFAFLDITPFCRNAAEAMVHDTFTACFESQDRVRWDNTFYLFPLQAFGTFVRYCILLPIRILIIFCGLLLTAFLLALSRCVSPARKQKLEDLSMTVVNGSFLWSWCAVVLEKGELPPREPGQIYVCNHSSVIDITMLLRRQKFSLTGQKHTGVIGFFQKHVLHVLGCLWFDRMEAKDRSLVSKAIREHSMDVTKPPLLVFPEGTCVNNEYVVMFKRGAFELGKSIVPVAIKYNKVFVDAYWNSREQSFVKHLIRLMTSWAVVCEVSYLDPQYRMPGESAIAFGTRVKELIAKEAGLKPVPWDGLLKYFKPRPEYKRNRQNIYAKMVQQRFGNAPNKPQKGDPPHAKGSSAAEAGQKRTSGNGEFENIPEETKATQ